LGQNSLFLAFFNPFWQKKFIFDKKNYRCVINVLYLRFQQRQNLTLKFKISNFLLKLAVKKAALHRAKI